MQNSNTSKVVQAILQARRKGMMKDCVGSRGHTLFTALTITKHVHDIRTQADAYVIIGATHQVLMDLGEHLAEVVADREWEVAELVSQASQVMINAAKSADRWLSDRGMEVDNADANFAVWSLYLSLEDENDLQGRKEYVLENLQEDNSPGDALIYIKMLGTIDKLMQLYDLDPNKIPIGRPSKIKNDRPN